MAEVSRLEKARQRLEAAKKAVAAAEKVETAAKRRRLARQKIVVGARLMGLAEAGDAAAKSVLRRCLTGLSARDAQAFDRDELAALIGESVEEAKQPSSYAGAVQSSF